MKVGDKLLCKKNYYYSANINIKSINFENTTSVGHPVNGIRSDHSLIK